MSMPDQLRSRAASLVAASILASGAMAVSGCLISPTGSNKATNIYATPDADGNIVLKFKAPEGATSATFTVRNGEAEAVTDDSPDGGKEGDDTDPCKESSGEFCAAFKAGTLAPNIYLVDVTVDDKSEKAATLAFIVPADAGATPAADDEATPPADGEGGDGEGDGGGGEGG